uniref:Uncharacterized protein n=1 Tax=Oryza brachyantha TaxID=4533 RepID=J3M7G3_ORYBR
RKKSSLVLVLERDGEVGVGEQLERAERGDQPVEVVEVRAVEVVGDPAAAPRRRRPVDPGHERTADEAADAEDAEIERQPEAT